MAHVDVPRPKIAQTLVAKNGGATREHYWFLYQLWLRTGGANDAVGGALIAANNLSDVQSAGNSRVNLGFSNPILDKTEPGNIGVVTPGTGNFTTLTGINGTYTGTLTVTGKFFVDTNENVAVGDAALATTATDGFLYITSMAGPPTGTPTVKTGLTPIVVDSTNDDLYVYVGGAWKSTALV